MIIGIFSHMNTYTLLANYHEISWSQIISVLKNVLFEITTQVL